METFQAGLDGVVMQCQGSMLLGGLYRGAGTGPRPTAILVHGLPGIEKNLDIAYGLRESGWNCLFFHQRGSWGSGGAYSLPGRQEDLRAATEWVVRQPCVDAQRLALVGHSAGGHVVLMAAAADSRFRATVALCPLVSPARVPLPLEWFEEVAQMLDGITAVELKEEYEALPPVESVAEQLREQPILIVTGGQDDVLPPAQYAPLRAAAPTIEWREFQDGDHFLSLCRQEAAELTVKWLVSHLGQLAV